MRGVARLLAPGRFGSLLMLRLLLRTVAQQVVWLARLQDELRSRATVPIICTLASSADNPSALLQMQFVGPLNRSRFILTPSDVLY